MTNAANAPEGETLYHHCFGGNIECSAFNPCPDCLVYWEAIVVPEALVTMGYSPVNTPMMMDGIRAGIEKLQTLARHDPRVRANLKSLQLRDQRAPAPPPALPEATKTPPKPPAVAAPPPPPPAPPTPQTPEQALEALAPPPSFADPAGTPTASPVPAAAAAPSPSAPALAPSEMVRPRALPPMAREMTAEEIASGGRIVTETDPPAALNGRSQS